MPKLVQGRYTAAYVRWGKVLDLHAENLVVLMGCQLHGGLNQKWEFIPCGAGFIINSLYTGSFLTVRDLRGQGSLEVVIGAFPTCWELEAMNNRNTEDGAEDESGDVCVRIRLPHSEMALSLEAGHDGAAVVLRNAREDMNTYWRLSPVVRQQVVNTTHPVSSSVTVMTPAIITTTVTPTTVTITTSAARTVAGDV